MLSEVIRLLLSLLPGGGIAARALEIAAKLIEREGRIDPQTRADVQEALDTAERALGKEPV